MDNTLSSVERALADLFGYSYAILFGRARSALVTLLEIVGVHERFPVLLPSNICPAVLTAICGAGATPQLVPVCIANGLPPDESLAREIESRGIGGVVMITHLYGFRQSYPQTLAAAARQGWFVLENDSLAVTARLDSSAGRTAFGDALLVSFGYAKTLEIGGGGAVLTDDHAVASELRHRANLFPPLGDAAIAAEAKFTELRRRYRQQPLSMPRLAEGLLPAELKELRYAFPAQHAGSLTSRIRELPELVRRRQERAAFWEQELKRLGEVLIAPNIAPVIPWRVIRRAPCYRSRLVSELRKNGFDAGTNFPPLVDSYPNLLGEQRFPAAEQWGSEVINFWVSDDYDDDRIKMAVGVMERCHPNS